MPNNVIKEEMSCELLKVAEGRGDMYPARWLRVADASAVDGIHRYETLSA